MTDLSDLVVKHDPETEFEVAQATSLTTREMPVDEFHEFMRCQLGMWTLDADKSEVFVLKAHGTCWRDCWKQWRGLEERRAAEMLA